MSLDLHVCPWHEIIERRQQSLILLVRNQDLNSQEQFSWVSHWPFQPRSVCLSILRFKLRLLFFSKYVILAFQSIWSLINRLPEISLILWKKHPKKSSLECWLTTRTISGQIFSPSEPRFTCLLNECNKTLLIRVLWRVNEILPAGHPYYHHRIL